MEYRLNYITDIFIQPTLTGWIEVLLWKGVFLFSATATIGGFDQSYYFAYALWAAFVSRISANWMYEFKMIEEIETGSINSILVKPISFFEYYLYQFLGYKIGTAWISLIIPIGISYYFNLPFDPIHFLWALLLIALYLVFIFTISFIVATTAFHLTKVNSITIAKNLALWIFTGELIPIDLFPSSIKNIFLYLPFSSAVYLPVAFITKRVDFDTFKVGFISTSISLLLVLLVANAYWRFSLKKYVGTGA